MAGRAALVFLIGLVAAAGASCRAADGADADTTVVRAIGPDYGAGWLHRALFGRDYRDLWTAPIAVPVLDLASFEGGLTAVARGGGRQTTSLRLRAADGREYYFRSIDKDPAANLPPELRGTVVASVVKDQTSATMPGASLVVAPLLAAAGVLHGEPHLYVLPDDPRLGEHRDLAGLVGILEPRLATGWHEAAEIISGDELIARIDASCDDRVDARAFLKARLLDILVGDWDRHRDQWSWARFDDHLPRRWQPIPRDRDYAMVRYDGLALGIARVKLPQLLQFSPRYDGIVGLTWNGRELDRRFLMEPEAAVWDTVVAEIQAVLTDSVIAAAVRCLPPPYQDLRGPWLTDALTRRRDSLGDVSRRFYAMLLAGAEVRATDGDDAAFITVVDPRVIDVATYRRGGPSSAAPYYTRRFYRDDTREIRLFMGAGRDTVRVAGDASPDIQLRVVGGAGEDVLLAPPGQRGLTMHDEDPGTVVTGGAVLDRGRYTPPPKRYATEISPRDWGRSTEPAGTLTAGPDIGVLVGVGRTYTIYGFRKLPYASQHRWRLAYATEPSSFRADYRGRFRQSYSRRVMQLMVRASGIDVLRFHGFGNDVAAPGRSEYYSATQDQVGGSLALVAPLGAGGEVTAGPVVNYVSTDDRPDRFLSTLDPYGSGHFGQVGAKVDATLASGGRAGSDQPLLDLAMGGSVYPPWWDVARTYGEVHASAIGFVRFAAPLAPVLRLRAGGKVIWGPYPYFDAAFIGDPSSVRLGRENRYAGDAASYGSGELYVTLGRAFLGAPSEFGVFGLADTGRVFVAGESSRRWHAAAGGGVWLSVLDRSNTIRLSYADSEERQTFYFQGGFGF